MAPKFRAAVFDVPNIQPVYYFTDIPGKMVLRYFVVKTG